MRHSSNGPLTPSLCPPLAVSQTLRLHRLPLLLTPSLLLPLHRPWPPHLRRPLAPQHTMRASWALWRKAFLVQTAKPALTKAPLAQVGRLGVRLSLRGVPWPSWASGFTVGALLT